MTSSHSYSRRRPSRTPRPSIVILVEGEVTEVEYLNALREACGISRDLIDIHKAKCSDADGIVAEAKELLAKSGGGREPKAFDEIWVVANAESEHSNGSPENISHAINHAGDSIHLVLDSPSIEYWFLLHFIPTTRDFPSAADVIAKLKQYWHEYSKQSKTLDWNALLRKTEAAMKNAASVRKTRRESRADRPLADMDVLAAKLKSMGKGSIPRAKDETDRPRPAYESLTYKDLYSWEKLHHGSLQR